MLHCIDRMHAGKLNLLKYSEFFCLCNNPIILKLYENQGLLKIKVLRTRSKFWEHCCFGMEYLEGVICCYLGSRSVWNSVIVEKEDLSRSVFLHLVFDPENISNWVISSIPSVNKLTRDTMGIASDLQKFQF